MHVSNAQISSLPVTSLKPQARQARTHSPSQLKKLASSIRRFGFITPVLIDLDDRIVAGHARVEAAKLAGLKSVPTMTVAHLSPGELRAFILADNQIATLASWDRKLLSIEINELMIECPDIDLTVTGFELEELEIISDASASKREELGDESALPDVDINTPATSIPGDLWLIGDHRLYCGSALDRGSFATLLNRERADLVITDPPYGVPITGHVCGTGNVQHREFVMGGGDMSRMEFSAFLSTACENMARVSRSGSLHYVFMDWRSIELLLSIGSGIYTELMNVIVWNKGQAGMGSMYRSQHELVALFKYGKRSHKNRVMLGANGRNRTNVWSYPAATRTGSSSELSLHPTVKNLQMIAEAIRDSSDVDDIVLDPFAGSGTTLLAAAGANRRARLIELDPKYCDLIIERSSAVAPARLEATGELYADVSKRRANELIIEPQPAMDGGVDD